MKCPRQCDTICQTALRTRSVWFVSSTFQSQHYSMLMFWSVEKWLGQVVIGHFCQEPTKIIWNTMKQVNCHTKHKTKHPKTYCVHESDWKALRHLSLSHSKIHVCPRDIVARDFTESKFWWCASAVVLEWSQVWSKESGFEQESGKESEQKSILTQHRSSASRVLFYK